MSRPLLIGLVATALAIFGAGRILGSGTRAAHVAAAKRDALADLHELQAILFGGRLTPGADPHGRSLEDRPRGESQPRSNLNPAVSQPG